MDSMSFDPIASVYDTTRVFDQKCFDSALDYLVERFPPSKFPGLFEPGVGTGRIAIPFAQRGYRVTGVDISEEMLQRLAEKLKRVELPIEFQKADVTRLPFADAAFDIVVVVHLFHLIPDWKTAVREVFRVLRPGAPLIFMNTGDGTEVPFINQRYAALCAEFGQAAERLGPSRKSDEIMDYLSSLGKSAEKVEDRWQWTHRIPVDKALSYMRSRSSSLTNIVTDDVHQKACDQLERELTKQYPGPAAEVEVSNEIKFIIVLPA